MKKIHQIALLLLLFCSNETVKAATFVAKKSGIWHDPETWQCGGCPQALPAASDVVQIPNGFTVTLNSDAVCFSLQVFNGGSFVFENEPTLTLAGGNILAGTVGTSAARGSLVLSGGDCQILNVMLNNLSMTGGRLNSTGGSVRNLTLTNVNSWPNSKVLTLDSMGLANLSNVVWKGIGTLKISPTATLQIASARLEQPMKIINQGTWKMSGGKVEATHPEALCENLGTLEVDGSTPTEFLFSIGKFTNRGKIIKKGAATLWFEWLLENDPAGEIQIEAGTFEHGTRDPGITSFSSFTQNGKVFIGKNTVFKLHKSSTISNGILYPTGDLRFIRSGFSCNQILYAPRLVADSSSLEFKQPVQIDSFVLRSCNNLRFTSNVNKFQHLSMSTVALGHSPNGAKLTVKQKLTIEKGFNALGSSGTEIVVDTFATADFSGRFQLWEPVKITNFGKINWKTSSLELGGAFTNHGEITLPADTFNIRQLNNAASAQFTNRGVIRKPGTGAFQCFLPKMTNEVGATLIFEQCQALFTKNLSSPGKLELGANCLLELRGATNDFAQIETQPGTDMILKVGKTTFQQALDLDSIRVADNATLVFSKKLTANFFWVTAGNITLAAVDNVFKKAKWANAGIAAGGGKITVEENLEVSGAGLTNAELEIPPTGQMQICSSGMAGGLNLIGKSLTNRGNLLWCGGTMGISAGGQLNNFGNFEISGKTGHNLQIDQEKPFDNFGTITKNDSSWSSLSVFLRNQPSGKIVVNNNFLWIQGSLENRGIIEIASKSTLVLHSANSMSSKNFGQILGPEGEMSLYASFDFNAPVVLKKITGSPSGKQATLNVNVPMTLPPLLDGEFYVNLKAGVSINLSEIKGTFYLTGNSTNPVSTATFTQNCHADGAFFTLTKIHATVPDSVELTCKRLHLKSASTLDNFGNIKLISIDFETGANTLNNHGQLFQISDYDATTYFYENSGTATINNFGLFKKLMPNGGLAFEGVRLNNRPDARLELPAPLALIPDFTNEGIFAPGKGKIQWQHHFEMKNTARLEIEFFGKGAAGAADGFDQIRVAGLQPLNLQLTGTLHIFEKTGAVSGGSFPIMNYTGVRSGKFQKIEVSPPDFAANWSVEYDDAQKTVNAVRCTAGVSAGKDTAACGGSGNFQLAALPTSGAGPFSFVWSPAQFLDDPTAPKPIADLTQPTHFAVTMTTADGCKSVDSVFVAFAQSQVFYADSDGDGFGDPQNVKTDCQPPAGFVQNADDCNDSAPLQNPTQTEICNGADDNCDGTVDENSALQIIAATTTDVACFGEKTGRIEVKIAGGEPPFEWQWAGGAAGNSPILENLPAGNYSLTVTKLGRCMAAKTFVIGQPATALQVSNERKTLSGGKVQVKIVATGGTLISADTPYRHRYLMPNGGDWSAWSGDPVFDNLSFWKTRFQTEDANGCRAEQLVYSKKIGGVVSSDTIGGDGEQMDFGKILQPATPPDLGLKIYPNPARDWVVVEIGAAAAAGKLSVFDLAGRLVFEKNWTGGSDKFFIETASWKAGVYFLEAQFLTGEALPFSVRVMKME